MLRGWTARRARAFCAVTVMWPELVYVFENIDRVCKVYSTKCMYKHNDTDHGYRTEMVRENMSYVFTSCQFSL